MSGTVHRDKLWYWLHDQDGRVAELDIKLDILDAEIHALQTIKHEETRTKLERLGFDVSNYRPPPPLLPSEQRCLNHSARTMTSKRSSSLPRRPRSTALTASSSPPARPRRRTPTPAPSRSSGAASARCSASDSPKN
jgi:hypothetical protein